MHEIVGEAVDLERTFCCDALSVSLVEMNAALMEQYISFVADRLFVTIGYTKLYNANNPFDWMEQISLQGKTNLFEKRVAYYQKSGVLSSLHGRRDNDVHYDHVFTTSADF